MLSTSMCANDRGRTCQSSSVVPRRPDSCSSYRADRASDDRGAAVLMISALGEGVSLVRLCPGFRVCPLDLDPAAVPPTSRSLRPSRPHREADLCYHGRPRPPPAPRLRSRRHPGHPAYAERATRTPFVDTYDGGGTTPPIRPLPLAETPPALRGRPRNGFPA